MPIIGWIAGGAGALLAGFLVFFAQELRTSWAVEEVRIKTEVQVTRRETAYCEQRIATIRTSLSDDAITKLDEAAAARRGVAPTPIERAEIEWLCTDDRYCRERSALIKKDVKDGEEGEQ